jgi:hypothetical protein
MQLPCQLAAAQMVASQIADFNKEIGNSLRLGDERWLIRGSIPVPQAGAEHSFCALQHLSGHIQRAF